MKNSTAYISEIIETGKCRVYDAEMITDALHREGILHKNLVLRFRLLFGDFDFVTKEWLQGNYNQNIKNFYNGNFTSPDEIVERARVASDLYIKNR